MDTKIKIEKCIKAHVNLTIEGGEELEKALHNFDNAKTKFYLALGDLANVLKNMSLKEQEENPTRDN